MNCALCDSTENIWEETLAMGWDEYLLNERGFHIFGSVSVPVCESCLDRWARHRGKVGYTADSAAEAGELLDDLILENLIQLDDMGNRIEEVDDAE